MREVNKLINKNQPENGIKVFRNGHIVTVDDHFSICTALATCGDKILAIGSDQELQGLADKAARVVDLGGRTVVPGLIDAHAHMDREGLKGVYPSLAGARSIDDILGRIEALVNQAEPGEWIVTMPIGDPPSYWDPVSQLKEGRWPTRQDLDQVSPRNPVYIRPIWGFWRHSLPLVSIANSLALERCGVGRTTVSPAPSVSIEKDGGGEPTGIFVEHTFMSIVELTLMREAGRFSRQQRVEAIARAASIYNSFGTTSIFEEHGAAGELIAAYGNLRDQGRLTVRTNLLFSPSWSSASGTPPEQLLATWGGWLGGHGVGDDYLRVAGLYALLEQDGDGPRSPLENSLRASANPYTGWAGFYFDAGLPREHLKSVLIEAARNNIRCAALTPDILDLYEEVDRIVPIRDQRWIIGHLSVLTKEQISRIRDLGLVVTTHTNRYIWRTGAKMMESVGPGNETTISPLASLQAAGVPFCLATDNVPVSLFHPIWHSIARLERTEGRVIAPSEKISRQDALRAATIHGAYITFDEKVKGSLEPGKLADFACLDKNLLTVPEEEIKDITADFVVVGGETVYERPGESRP